MTMETKELITIERMLGILADEGGYIKVEPEDWVQGFSKRQLTKDALLEKFPAKYRDDVIGFEYVSESTYYPKFHTMQDEWDNELKDYCRRKQEWCDKYGCD